MRLSTRSRYNACVYSYRPARRLFGLLQPRLVGFLGEILRGCVWLALDRIGSSGRCCRNSSKGARRFDEWGTIRSRSARSARGRDISGAFAPEGTTPRRTWEHSEVVWIEYRHRGPQVR